MVIFSRSAPSNSSVTSRTISSFVGGDFFAFLLNGSSSEESPESTFFSEKKTKCFVYIIVEICLAGYNDFVVYSFHA